MEFHLRWPGFSLFTALLCVGEWLLRRMWGLV